LVGVAVKVTEVPEHTGLADAAIETLTGRFGFTVILIVFEVAGFPDGQVALEVRTQEIASLFNGTTEKVALVAPGAFAPFTFHW
jgi:hypothetical protein